MSYSLRFTPESVKDIKRHKKSGNKQILQKLEVLFEELREHPRTGTGQPEKLKHALAGYYSRRNKKHRLVYEIKDEIVTVIVLSAHSHYDVK